MDTPIRWRTILATVAVAYGVLVVGGLVVIYAGLYDVAATAPHWPLTTQVFETARRRSIERHAAGIRPPDGPATDATVLAGVDHFAAHCAVCHGAPGVPKGDIAEGLHPAPPDLKEAAQRYTSAELFWILKHGIKMSGMPAWNDHTDDELWATVAFLARLPTMSEADYAKLIMANMMQGGGHHHGGTDDPAHEGER